MHSLLLSCGEPKPCFSGCAIRLRQGRIEVGLERLMNWGTGAGIAVDSWIAGPARLGLVAFAAWALWRNRKVGNSNFGSWTGG
jgi:hypothetical protein